eukprot:m.193726 g.193726  ORF g.193726 m.193726 type:complete len:85 (+) comp39482_c1_seq31:1459-1713(+)
MQQRFVLPTQSSEVDDGLGSLPEGWERRENAGRGYYVNHSARTTQWEDPRQHSQLGEAAKKTLPPGKRWKILLCGSHLKDNNLQ